MTPDIDSVILLLRDTVARWRDPIVTEMSKRSSNPFLILISTVISLRTKDEVTRTASERLFALADTPERMAGLGEETIQRAIYPAGFYQNKAKHIVEISRELLAKYGGRVPDDLDELLTLPGVGRKTANLVITKGYGKLGICVDTHVHRISNRLGYIATKNPTETEFSLREKLPEKYWIEYNDLLVSFGQHLCKPVSPFCSRCPIHDQCRRVGVTVHR